MTLLFLVGFIGKVLVLETCDSCGNIALIATIVYFVPLILLNVVYIKASVECKPVAWLYKIVGPELTIFIILWSLYTLVVFSYYWGAGLYLVGAIAALSMFAVLALATYFMADYHDKIDNIFSGVKSKHYYSERLGSFANFNAAKSDDLSFSAEFSGIVFVDNASGELVPGKVAVIYKNGIATPVEINNDCTVGTELPYIVVNEVNVRKRATPLLRFDLSKYEIKKAKSGFGPIKNAYESLNDIVEQ